MSGTAKLYKKLNENCNIKVGVKSVCTFNLKKNSNCSRK